MLKERRMLREKGEFQAQPVWRERLPLLKEEGVGQEQAGQFTFCEENTSPMPWAPCRQLGVAGGVGGDEVFLG